MKNIFEHASSNWVKYSEYELKHSDDGKLYVKPKDDAMPQFFDIMRVSQDMVLEALNIGLSCIRKHPEEEIQEAIMGFVSRYGLLGIMTTLPTTPSFMDYEAVYLTKNRFIKTEVMDTMEYLSLFFPFDMLQIEKHGIESMWEIEGDRVMQALALTMGDKPMAVSMGFQRIYAERYDWIRLMFVDWAATLSIFSLYYDKEAKLSEETRRFYQSSMAVFGGIAPTYHVALLDTPTLVWDFHSLALAIQMIFNLMLTDDKYPVRICKHCAKAFVATRPSGVFCSPQCKNRYNVYKSRSKEKPEK